MHGPGPLQSLVGRRFSTICGCGNSRGWQVASSLCVLEDFNSAFDRGAATPRCGFVLRGLLVAPSCAPATLAGGVAPHHDVERPLMKRRDRDAASELQCAATRSSRPPSSTADSRVPGHRILAVTDRDRGLARAKQANHLQCKRYRHGQLRGGPPGHCLREASSEGTAAQVTDALPPCSASASSITRSVAARSRGLVR